MPCNACSIVGGYVYSSLNRADSRPAQFSKTAAYEAFACKGLPFHFYHPLNDPTVLWLLETVLGTCCLRSIGGDSAASLAGRTGLVEITDGVVTAAHDIPPCFPMA